MNISFDYGGCYPEHKLFFDEMARSMQAKGHRVGIITGERELDPYTGASIKQKIMADLGFTPDFFHMWGAYETIGSGDLWKCQKMDAEDVYLHFDDDAATMKKYTDRWVVKVLNSADTKKF